MKIEIRSSPHQKIPVQDIQPNPHRDLKRNPIKPERVEELIASFERTGFWENIVVRRHPEEDDKFQLAYGHNRLAALKDPRVAVDTITIPVADLNDWEMYCAMVDENETQGAVTPEIAFENVEVGCVLVERALTAIGPEGTWEEFERAVGRAVAAATTQNRNGHGFEQVRNTFFAGEGLGRKFLSDYLPCGKMREHTISEIVKTRYGAARAAKKAAEAEAARIEAEEKRKAAIAEAEATAAERRRLKEEADKKVEEERQAKEAAEAKIKAEKDAEKAAKLKAEEEKAEEKRKADAEKREAERKAAEKAAAEREAKLKAEAEKKEAEAKKLSAEAERIGEGFISENVLLMFGTPKSMTEFASAIRKIGIPREKHEAAAKEVLKEEIYGSKIKEHLDLWWDQVSGAAEKRRKSEANSARREKVEKALKERMRGITYPEYLWKILEDLRAIEGRVDTAITGSDLICEAGIKTINEIAKITDKLDNLVERTREAFKRLPQDVTPSETMLLTHQEGNQIDV